MPTSGLDFKQRVMLRRSSTSRSESVFEVALGGMVVGIWGYVKW